MSPRLAAFLLAALSVASVAFWLDQAIRRCFRGLRVDCATCPCGATS